MSFLWLSRPGQRRGAFNGLWVNRRGIQGTRGIPTAHGGSSFARQAIADCLRGISPVCLRLAAQGSRICVGKQFCPANHLMRVKQPRSVTRVNYPAVSPRQRFARACARKPISTGESVHVLHPTAKCRRNAGALWLHGCYALPLGFARACALKPIPAGDLTRTLHSTAKFRRTVSPI